MARDNGLIPTRRQTRVTRGMESQSRCVKGTLSTDTRRRMQGQPLYDQLLLP